MSRGGARKGAGRKPIADPMQMVGFRADSESRNLIKEVAKALGKTPAEYIRDSVLRDLAIRVELMTRLMKK